MTEVSIRSERVELAGSRGARLSARLELPAEPPAAFALFAHCFTCSKDGHAASRISRGLAARGVAVLRFDFTGLGSSDGDFASTTFSSNVGDLLRAAEYLAAHHRAPQLLVGHSLGGAAAIQAAASMPGVRGVATIGAPAEPKHVVALLGEAADAAARDGEAVVTLGARSFRIRRELLEDLEHQQVREALATTQAALLLFHSPTDGVVPIDEARRLFAAASHPKSFVALDSADHLLTDRADAAFVADVLGAWVRRYVLKGGASP